MRRGLALLLTATLALSMTACGGSKGAGTQKSEKGDGMTYAVEAGSAGEAVAKEKGFNYNSVSSQADALMEVKSGTSDAAIIDLLMAGAMIGEGTSYPDLVHTTELTSEKYGVGCRKGSDLASYINSVLADSYADGSSQEIAKKYGVQDSLLEQEPCEFKQSDSDSDVDYIKSQGKMIVGITEFEPMDYKDKDDKWIGFDADMARLVGEKLGVDVEFVVIDWDNKVIELDAKSIDCIWNGMTITDELAKSIDFSLSYSGNMQVCVISSANEDKFKDAASINAAGVQIGAEAGSAGEAAVSANFPNAAYTAVNAQRDCLLELKSGTLDVGVLDYVMAVTMTGDGTDYADLMIVDGLELSKEEFAVGLRKGSDFTAKLNDTLQALKDDGTVDALAKKYPSVMVTL